MPSGVWAFKVHVFKLFSVIIRNKIFFFFKRENWDTFLTINWNFTQIMQDWRWALEGWQQCWFLAGCGWDQGEATRCPRAGFVHTTKSTEVPMNLASLQDTRHQPRGPCLESGTLWCRSPWWGISRLFCPPLTLFSWDRAKPSHSTDLKMALR